MQEKIVGFLKNCEGYLSGEEISRKLNISRSAIWKNMQELRKIGYDIVAVPHLGYRLLSSPDLLLPYEIQHNLKTSIIGKQFVYFDSIDSTMDHAYQLGIQGAAEGTVVCAENQAKGRGRLGRSWSSPKGQGITLSIILRPKLSTTQVAKFTLLSAVSTAEAINKISGISCQIKWPNDILVGDKKLAGFLTELNAEMDQVRFVIIGMGINVNTPQHLLPENAISMKEILNQSVSRIDLTKSILQSLEHWYGASMKHGFSNVIKRWKELSTTLGKRVRIIDDYGDVEGDAFDLDEYGGLMIRHQTGITVKRMTGDVIHL